MIENRRVPSDQRGYEYYDGTDDDDGDFLLIRKEDLEKLAPATSGNSIFDDYAHSSMSKIPKGKYYVVQVKGTQEH
tara:strand:- start:194 stop:421 length:228 start_codon:yes stop_codon:yes gene_type:complete